LRNEKLTQLYTPELEYLQIPGFLLFNKNNIEFKFPKLKKSDIDFNVNSRMHPNAYKEVKKVLSDRKGKYKITNILNDLKRLLNVKLEKKSIIKYEEVKHK